MTAKEWNDHLIKKWSFMIKPLNQKKTSQTKFAKMFEQTVLYTNTNTVKLALIILQKLLYTLPGIKSSASSKNSIFIGEIEKDSIIDGGILMPDATMSFINYITAIIEERHDEFEKLNHIMLSEELGNIQVYIIY